jgi:hypothetical protein
MVTVSEKLPSEAEVSVPRVCEGLSHEIVIVAEAAKPDPLTITEDPTAPLTGLRVIETVISKFADASTVPPDDSMFT